MILTPIQKARYGDNDEIIRGVSRKDAAVNRWHNNVIPYILSNQYTEPQKQIIRSSLQSMMQQIPCYKFVERTNEYDYLFVVPLDGCYSYVGKMGGRQMISLAADCLADYIIWHEFVHVIGFEHEHQRPDRDHYIKVEYKNVEKDQIGNFEKLSPNEVDYPDVYDYHSIMHYDGYAFGRIDFSKGIRLATMIPLKSDVQLLDNMKFTPTDILKINRFGNCDANGNPKLSANKAENSQACHDQTFTCAMSKQKGLCAMAIYRGVMKRNCASTCNLCKYKLHHSSQNETNISETSSNATEPTPPVIVESRNTTTVTVQSVSQCKNARSNCYQFKAQCRNPLYYKLMVRFCPETCNFCQQREELGDCFDTDDNCAALEKNGFCKDDFYVDIRKERCKKTCGLCS